MNLKLWKDGPGWFWIIVSDASLIRTDTLIKVLPSSKTNISHLGKRKIIFKYALSGDMLIPWRVHQDYLFAEKTNESYWSSMKEFFSRPSASLKEPGTSGTSKSCRQNPAMSHELKVTTVEGGILTLEVMPANTIEELKAMLREKKHCQDPIEHQILKVKVLADGLLVDDDQTLESAGLLHADSETTVIFCRNEVEAATKEAIHTEGLLQVNIPSSLTEISEGAFKLHDRVVKVTIPASITSIGSYAFCGCSSLASITIPESVTAIGDGAFANCKSLASITLPESVTAIGGRAFEGCSSLANISLPESVTVIGGRAFEGCSSLADITLPESVTAVEDCAFRHCESLASIAIPESVTAIGFGAFAGCSSFASITLPESLTFISNNAFEGCSSLESMTIPQSVTAIGDFAFEGCSSLESITIPESLKDDGRWALDGKFQVKRRKVWISFFVAYRVVSNIFLFSPLLGEDSHFDKYFSTGLKPSTCCSCWNFGLSTLNRPSCEGQCGHRDQQSDHFDLASKKKREMKAKILRRWFRIGKSDPPKINKSVASTSAFFRPPGDAVSPAPRHHTGPREGWFMYYIGDPKHEAVCSYD